ncbi:MAG TPA: hypothetical protein VMD53_14160 [Rhizomicrobium sp.]|nr:hypothetical protein [Rhizomicrobium sp.]
MITLEDCIAMSGLDAEEVAAIAEHEHVPEIAASALANYILRKIGGEKEIRQMIVDDIRAALDDGRMEHATELFMALRHFLSLHPDAQKS